MSESNEFERVISTVTGERALSDRQAAFVDAIIEHSRTNSPYSPEDERALRLAARVLGLGEYLDPLPERRAASEDETNLTSPEASEESPTT